MGDDTITVVRYAERYVAPEVASWEVAVEATDREAGRRTTGAPRWRQPSSSD